MRLILFGGFLGSGKTTLIVRLANALALEQGRIAVLVNEVGEIGIDDQLMRRLGLDVWELASGCICCTLAAGLLDALKRITTDYAPEIVFVEASGVADPSKVLEMLPRFRGPEIDDVRTIVVLDPLRLPMLFEVVTPLITTQIQHADTLIISKADIASADEIEATRKIGIELNREATVFALGAKETDQWPIQEIIQ